MNERIEIDESSPWYAEHRSRYRFAGAYVQGKVVLDAATGAAYGLSILTESGATALGVDLHVPAALGEAFAVVRGRCERLPIRTASVDVVTSFETIEHVRSDTSFVSEIRRVLRPDGLLILSTPNALRTKPVDGVPANPYHVREYEPKELKALLGTCFSSVTLLGQQTSAAFGVCPFWDATPSKRGGWHPQVRGVLWRLAARLPSAARDVAWRLSFKQPFYPSESDFAFDEANVDTGHVTLAICRP